MKKCLLVLICMVSVSICAQEKKTNYIKLIFEGYIYDLDGSFKTNSDGIVVDGKIISTSVSCSSYSNSWNSIDYYNAYSAKDSLLLVNNNPYPVDKSNVTIGSEYVVVKIPTQKANDADTKPVNMPNVPMLSRGIQ